jgi:hypothetical protein
MKIRIGVIGPKDSVKRICELASEIKDVVPLPFPYTHIEESADIVMKNRDRVHQWFFSGQSPYFYSLQQGVITKEEAGYPPLYGTGLLGSLLQAQYSKGKLLKRVSLDTVQKEDLETIQKEILMNSIEFSMYPYEGYLPADDLIHFHQEQYEKGKVEVSFSCLEKVYTTLKERGIPCFRVTPSSLVIKQILEELKKRAQSVIYRNNQLSIIGIEIIDDNNVSMEKVYSYQYKMMELELKQVLIRYAELVSGSLVQIGDGLFFIYTTRGELENEIKEQSPLKLLDDAHVHSNLSIRIGVGYGLSAYEAEQHSRIALNHARRHHTSKFIIVNEDKTIIEKSTDENNEYFETKKWGDQWESMFKDTGITPVVLSKIESTATRNGKEVVTSLDLSWWLKCTERNARRILNELEKKGFVKASGIEHSGGRGRPRKIYQLLFQEKLNIVNSNE